MNFLVHYDRPYHAANPTTSTAKPCCAARPHEEPNRCEEDSKTYSGGHHQDSKVMVLPLSTLSEHVSCVGYLNTSGLITVNAIFPIFSYVTRKTPGPLVPLAS